MWCDYCQRPVAGQKPTSRARNTVVGLTVPLTSGLSLLGAKINKPVCPICGQPVRPATPQDFGAPPSGSATPRAKPTAERAKQLAAMKAKKAADGQGGFSRKSGERPRKRKRRR